jgi:hypothetical protein
MKVPLLQHIYIQQVRINNNLNSIEWHKEKENRHALDYKMDVMFVDALNYEIDVIRLSNYLEPTDHNNILESITRIPEAAPPSSSGWLLIAVLVTHNDPTKPSSSKLSRQNDLKKEKRKKEREKENSYQ